MCWTVGINMLPMKQNISMKFTVRLNVILPVTWAFVSFVGELALWLSERRPVTSGIFLQVVLDPTFEHAWS